MTQTTQTNFKTVQVKAASALLFTFASSVLIPTALHYATSGYTLGMVLAVSLIWIAFLATMWMAVMDSVRRRFDARVESARAFSIARARLRTRLVVQCETMPSVARSAELLAAYSMGLKSLIPVTAPASMSHLAGA